MFGRKVNIAVTIRLYAGIGKEEGLENYDEGSGICVKTVRGERLKNVLKTAGIRNPGRYIYFRNNLRISPRARLNDGDSISCLRLSGGG